MKFLDEIHFEYLLYERLIFADAPIDIPTEAESLLIAAVAAYRAGKYLDVCAQLQSWKGNQQLNIDYNTDNGN